MLGVETSCHVAEQKEQENELEALSLFNLSTFSWPTTTTHATTPSSLLSLSHRHGGLKITSVRAFSVHLRPCTPTHSGDNSDGLATSGMFLAGLIMVTRNRLLRIQYPITTPLLTTACCTGSSPGHLSFSASAPGSINIHSELGRALHRLSEI
jgi:hypothetical protein